MGDEDSRRRRSPAVWSISASVSSTPATGAARTPSSPSAPSASSCWRRSGEALARNHGPSAPRIASDDCVRGRAPSPRRAASHVGQRQFHCGNPPPAAEPSTRTRTVPMIESNHALRSCAAHAAPRRRTMKVEVTAAGPAEIEAATLALVAGGLLVRKLDALFEGRLARSAADADPIAVVQVGRELRARRILLVAPEGLHPQPLRTAPPRAGRPSRGTGSLAWALDDTL